MRLLHTADTHLGFQAYRAVDEEGLNRREADLYDAFDAVVDHALEREVDLVVHAGDVFDSVRPTNRAIGRALDGLLRLTRAGIPVVLVAGNHETPRLKETGHVFRIFDYFDGLYPIYRGVAGSVEVPGLDGATVHGVPHVPDQATFEAEVERLEPSGDGPHVLVLHGTAPGIEGLPTGEFNDLTLPTDAFDAFDYVALGHYHVRTRVADHAWYSGSTERLTFAEAGVDKGCLLVDLDPAVADVTPLSVPARPMVQPDPIDCAGLDADAVRGRVVAALDGDLDGALVKVRLSNLARDVYQMLDIAALKRRAGDALHVEVQPEVVRTGPAAGDGAEGDGAGAGDGADGRTGAAIGALADEFEGYLARVPVEDLDKARLADTARRYLEEAQDAP